MQNQPHRHKDDHVFQYTFSDTVWTIDNRRNALYRIQDNVGQEENNETNFHQWYVKWTEENLSEEYRLVQTKIGGLVTLEQLLNSKDFVTDLLLESLKEATIFSLQPLLYLVVSMAKDLRQEFYPYFPQFLSTFIGLLNTKDSEQVEWTFYSLAHLFKTLKPFLMEDLSIVYNEILPLLNHRRNPEYVTTYASECFSYIARDIRDKDKFLAMLLSGLKNHVDGDSCGRLLFEIIKGVNHGMHTCAEEFLTNWMKSLTNSTMDREMLFQILFNCTNNLLQNTYPHNLDVFWKTSLDVLRELCDESPVEHDMAIRKILILVKQAIKYRNGKCLCRLNELIERLLSLCDSDISTETLMTVSQIVAMILMSPNLTITQLDASRMSKKILSTSHKNIFEDFVWTLVNWSQFEIIILPEFLKYFENHFECESSALELMTKIIWKKAPLREDGIGLQSWTTYAINLKSEKTISRIENIIKGVDQSETYIMCLTVYPHIVGNDTSESVRILENSVYQMLNDFPNYKTLSMSSMSQIDLTSLKKKFQHLSITIETIIHLDRNTTFDINQIAPVLLPYCNDGHFISSLRILDQLLSVQPEEKLHFQLFQIVYRQLASNFSSYIPSIRLLTAHILQYFSKREKQKEAEKRGKLLHAQVEDDIIKKLDKLELMEVLENDDNIEDEPSSKVRISHLNDKHCQVLPSSCDGSSRENANLSSGDDSVPIERKRKRKEIKHNAKALTKPEQIPFYKTKLTELQYLQDYRRRDMEEIWVETNKMFLSYYLRGVFKTREDEINCDQYLNEGNVLKSEKSSTTNPITTITSKTSANTILKKSGSKNDRQKRISFALEDDAKSFDRSEEPSKISTTIQFEHGPVLKIDINHSEKKFTETHDDSDVIRNPADIYKHFAECMIIHKNEDDKPEKPSRMLKKRPSTDEVPESKQAQEADPNIIEAKEEVKEVYGKIKKKIRHTASRN